MATWDIAVKLGTSNTSIFLSGNGIVLHEPTMVAFSGDGRDKRIRAVGEAALDMLGKAPDKTMVVSPVIDGLISDFGACASMLAEFLNKLYDGRTVKPRLNAILGVPTGLTFEERKLYEDVCFRAGINDVTMVDNIMLAGIGLDLPVETSFGGLIVNIGGGMTEIAVLSLCGIITGCSVNIGGNMMDRAIVDYVAGKFDLRIGINTARKIKTSIASLYKNDISKMTVSGLDLRTNNISSAEITASDVLDTVMPYYQRIAEAIEGVINVCPPDIAGEILRTGMFVSGGSSKIVGLDNLFESRLGLRVNRSQEPEFAAILGAGKLLSNDFLLNELLKQK